MTPKIIELDQTSTDLFTNRVSIEEMRSIWNDATFIYTDEELYKIREWLYAIAEVIINTVKRVKPTIIPLNTSHYEAAQGNSLRPGKYGRTG